MPGHRGPAVREITHAWCFMCHKKGTAVTTEGYYSLKATCFVFFFLSATFFFFFFYFLLCFIEKSSQGLEVCNVICWTEWAGMRKRELKLAGNLSEGFRGFRALRDRCPFLPFSCCHSCYQAWPSNNWRGQKLTVESQCAFAPLWSQNVSLKELHQDLTQSTPCLSCTWKTLHCSTSKGWLQNFYIIWLILAVEHVQHLARPVDYIHTEIQFCVPRADWTLPFCPSFVIFFSFGNLTFCFI